MRTKNILAELLDDVMQSREKRILSAEKKDQFYSEFKESISGRVDAMRAEQKRAYENIKDIALR